MDWDDLAYFISLVEEQTLTASAEKLGVQHSTVSRRIERLENKLALPLFNRLGKRYILTLEGEHLYAQAVEVQREIVTFERMAIEQNAMQGKVVISAPPVLANELLIKELPAFLTQYPDIVLHIRGDLHISDLHRKEADIALRLQRPTEEDLLIRTISSVRYGFFAHRDYIEHTLAEQWQLIEFQANQRMADWINSLVNQYNYSVIFSSNDLYLTYNSVCQQLGVAILPYFLASKNPNLLPVNPMTRTLITKEEIETAEGLFRANSHLNRESKRDSDIVSAEAPVSFESTAVNNGFDNAIPLTQSKPLYLVMHPDIRRSARVRAVAEWLGTVFSNS